MAQFSTHPVDPLSAAQLALHAAAPESTRDVKHDARGMSGQNIICFAKDWDEDPTSNNHIMKLLARNNRVLWLNSIATRTPSLRSSRDLGKIRRKLASFFRGPRHISDGLWVYTPIVLPLLRSRLATFINTFILRLALTVLRRRLGMTNFQLWVFIPTASRYVRKLGESLVVYYVTDEYSKFEYVDGAEVAASDVAMCGMADIIFATAQPLVDRRLPLNGRTYLSRHGVDHKLFSAALDPQTVIPSDMTALKPPVLGFYGALQHWLDQDLIEYLAQRHPEWSIALIGQPIVDMSQLCKYSNIHLLGRKRHAELPAYCKGLSVAMIPHEVCELTRHMNPIKLREYLSAGLPVVSVDLPEVAKYRKHCSIAKTYEEFERAVQAALATDSPQARRLRSDEMIPETWESRVTEIGSRVMAVQNKAAHIAPRLNLP